MEGVYKLCTSAFMKSKQGKDEVSMNITKAKIDLAVVCSYKISVLIGSVNTLIC